MDHHVLFKHRALPWLLLAPTLVVLVLFLYWPLLESIATSFYRHNLMLGTSTWIGLENYKQLFTGPFAPAFWQVLLQTLFFAACVCGPAIALSVFLAHCASRPMGFGHQLRLLLVWPFALSPAVAGTIFLFLFNPEVGLVNHLLAPLGIQPRWLDNPILAWLVAVGASLWKICGYNLVFYLAAYHNIPQSVAEAATLDGASGFGRFRLVFWPMLGPTTMFLLFADLSYAFFDSFGLVDILTGGGPVGPPPLDKAGLTSTLMYRVFADGFGGSSQMGFAAAEGLVLILIAAGIGWLQFRTSSDKVHYT